MVPELGVIEGYFGRPWGHEERKRVLKIIHDGIASRPKLPKRK